MDEPICIGCNKQPHELNEYVDAAQECGLFPADYVRREEGTYNPRNGHFLCTFCYIKAGMPSSPRGWIAP
jgi:hypothetical protein